jgi:hypothetical protein
MASPKIEEAEINRRFDYHAPDEEKATLHAIVRQAYKNIALNIADALPASREQSLALTALEESLMWANAAIARNPLE